MPFFRSGLVSAALLCLFLFAGCAAPVGLSGPTSLAADSANVCAGHCESIGLTLSSVVVMANNVGCVCAANTPPALSPPPASPVSQSKAAAAAAGGMAAILMVEEENRRAAQDDHDPQ